MRNDSPNDAPFVSVGIEIQPASQVAATQAAAAAAANLSPYFIPAGGSPSPFHRFFDPTQFSAGECERRRKKRRNAIPKKSRQRFNDYDTNWLR